MSGRIVAAELRKQRALNDLKLVETRIYAQRQQMDMLRAERQRVLARLKGADAAIRRLYLNRKPNELERPEL